MASLVYVAARAAPGAHQFRSDPFCPGLARASARDVDPSIAGTANPARGDLQSLQQQHALSLRGIDGRIRPDSNPHSNPVCRLLPPV